ncbi:MAG: hypothetical protein ACHQ50_04500 [Fimbriimonadales bacterium]
MRWLLLSLCACASACGSGQETAAYSELVLKGDAIAKQIQASLAGTKGELHSDKVDSDGTRHPGSFVQLGPQLHDRRFEFSLPDHVVNLGYAGKITYRVNDIRLKAVEMASTAGDFVLKAGFVSNGVAIKGSHSSLGESVVPGIKLDNMLLVVHLKPVVTGEGRITYDEPRVEFTADVDNTFIPRFTLLGHTVDVMDALTHYREDLCSSIQKQIQRALDDPTRKAALAQKISEGVSGQLAGPGGAILGLRFQGTDLVVRLRK